MGALRFVVFVLAVVATACTSPLLIPEEGIDGGTSDAPSSGDSGAGICKDGEHRCEGQSLESCAKDHQSFVLQETCAAGTTCDASAGFCRGSLCAPGNWRCNGSTLEKCNTKGTEWSTVAKCGGPCDAATHSCVDCVPGQKDCAGGPGADQPRVCDATGHWTTLDACSGATPNCVAGTCMLGECLDGTWQCTGDDLARCVGDPTHWEWVATCDPGACDAVGHRCK